MVFKSNHRCQYRRRPASKQKRHREMAEVVFPGEREREKKRYIS